MNALVVIAAGLSVVTGLPQYYPSLSSYYPAVAPTTYNYKVVPDVAPAPVHAAPYVVAAAAPPPVTYQSQHHAQDEFGQYSFGHASHDQVHNAVRDYTGTVRGSYAYIGADGKEVITHYIADDNGFRVASNALPVAPEFDGEAPVVDLEAPVFDLEAPVFDLEAPVMTLQQVEDTPEVEAAKLEHFRLVEEHKAAVSAALADKEVDTEAPAEEEEAVTEAAVTAEETVEEETTEEPVEEETTEAPAAVEEDQGERRRRHAVFYSAHPVVAHAAVSPVVRDAELLRIVHNPNHATSYRVY